MNVADLIQRNLPVGTALQGGSSTVTESGPKGATVTRLKTGSTVRITARKVQSTLDRLKTGEVIPKRGIDYTSAKEAGIVAALGDLVVLTGAGYEVASR